MSKNSRVFIPQEPRKHDPKAGGFKPLYDLSPALKFGTLEVLLPHGPLMLDTAPVVGQLKGRLADYTEDDYIMCIGDPLAIAAVVLVAGSISKKVTLLQYNRILREYNPVTYEV
jgi:hypothetical protein